jgi:8-oxo-dGTP pyrophosphatase MutT (NUDIX family)
MNTSGLLVIRDNKLLLAYSNNKKAWYLPGGKVDAGETSIQALQREVLEELNVTLDPASLRYYCHITAPAFGEQHNIIMEQDCYLYDLEQEITPGNEIGGVRYFDLPTYLSEPAQVVGVLEVFKRLQADKLI